MKQTLTAITFCIALSSLDAQHLKEKLFAETVTKVIEAFATQDSIALARLTDSKTGVWQHTLNRQTYGKK
ncbi:MAG TPA: hypothetical protein VHB48_18275 [Chitinophagaceae bacterium]|nr:hypothetical protein [Chitinophagaceae bacterium]